MNYTQMEYHKEVKKEMMRLADLLTQLIETVARFKDEHSQGVTVGP